MLLGRVAGHGEQGRRSPIALAEAWTPQPGSRLSLNDGVLRAETLFEGRDQLVRAVTATGQVVADVHDPRRAPLEREQRVERRDAVRVGRRHGKSLADIVERAGAEPADTLVNRVQDGEQEVAPGSRAVATVCNLALVVDLPHTAFPARGGGAEHAVDRRPLGGGGHGVEQVDVHGPIVPVTGARQRAAAGSSIVPRCSRVAAAIFSTRIAAALNSAVPDFGSVASMVSTFVSTSSGKCNVMNARPGRSE